MNRNREHLWQAYIDGELSAAEASEFEQSLEPTERELLAADAQFERRLGEKLAEPVACPDSVWEEIEMRARPTVVLTGNSGGSSASMPRRTMWAAATLAAAASLAFMISMALNFGADDGDTAIVSAASTVEELQRRAETDSTVEGAQAYFKAHDLPFEIDFSAERLFPPPLEVHKLDFLGMGTEQVNDELISEALFNCCGKPVKVLIMPRDSDAAVVVGRAMAIGSDVLAMQRRGKYLVAIVAEHSADELINAVNLRDEAAAR